VPRLRRLTLLGLDHADLESTWDGSRSRLARERPSDELSDNHHRRRWTPADTHGRSPQAMRAAVLAVRAGTWLRDEETIGSARAARHSAIPACRLRCRIKPYWIKAAPPRGAAGPASAPPRSLRRPARRTPGHSARTRLASMAYPTHRPIRAAGPQSPGRYHRPIGRNARAVPDYPQTSPALDAAAYGPRPAVTPGRLLAARHAVFSR
jgi:hypothetical protein